MSGGGILLECGVGSLGRAFPNRRNVSDMVKAVASWLEEETGVPATILVYSSVRSSNAGGRSSEHTTAEIMNLIRHLNDNGHPFVLALNGGLTVQRPQLDDTEKEILEVMASASSPRLRNVVTITSEQLREDVTFRFPELELIASCICQLDPRSPSGYGINGYRRSLETHRYAVVLNQHTTREYLKQLMQHAYGLIVFLTLKCGWRSLYDCYQHYARNEALKASCLDSKMFRTQDMSSFPEDIVAAPDYFFHGCYDQEDHRPEGALINRFDDLVTLIRLGIRGFKVHRDHVLSMNELQTLAAAVRAASTITV